MMNVIKKIWAVLALRCPNCGKGKLFTNPNLFNLKDIDKMPPRCVECEQDFEVEVEFYYGAMFVSYALTALVIIFLLGMDILITGYLYPKELFIYIGLIILGWTYWFRVSRAIWLGIYVWWLQPRKDK